MIKLRPIKTIILLPPGAALLPQPIILLPPAAAPFYQPIICFAPSAAGFQHPVIGVPPPAAPFQHPVIGVPPAAAAKYLNGLLKPIQINELLEPNRQFARLTPSGQGFLTWVTQLG
jgi:hypothetical protein